MGRVTIWGWLYFAAHFLFVLLSAIRGVLPGAVLLLSLLALIHFARQIAKVWH